MESERTSATAHDLGGADDIETAWRSRTYTAASMAPRIRLYGMSQKRSPAKMDGNTKRNTSSDEAFTARLRPPIHTVQRTIGRGLPRLGVGATSMGPVLRVTRPTPQNSRNARIRPACTTPRNARTETSRRGASCRCRSISERTVDYPMALATPRTRVLGQPLSTRIRGLQGALATTQTMCRRPADARSR
jgi:hypothetical protein